MVLARAFAQRARPEPRSLQVFNLRRGPAEMPARKKARHADAMPHGPKTYKETLSWPTRNLPDLREHDQTSGTELVKTLAAALDGRLILTTCYSGLGTPEYALAALHDAHAKGQVAAAASGVDPGPCEADCVPASASSSSTAPLPAAPASASGVDPGPSEAGVGGDWPVVHSLASAASALGVDLGPSGAAAAGGASCSHYSACDSDTLCQRVLLAHAADSLPAHVFDNIMGRLSPEVCQRLWNMHAKHKDRLLSKLPSTATQAAKRLLVDSLGAELIKDACGILSAAVIQDTAWCVACRKRCPLRPPNRHGALWLEVAGVTCVGFSNFGSRLKWLDKSALVCLTWAHWVLHAQPDLVIVECVAEWEPGPVETLFAKDWVMLHRVCCPSDLGHPTRRRRAYFTWGRRAKFCLLDTPENVAHLFGTLYFRRIAADGGIYLRTLPKELRRDLIRKLARARGMDVGLHEWDSLNPTAFLPVGKRLRLMEYITQVGEDAPAHCFVNIQQTSSFMPATTAGASLFPTLLRTSELADIGTDRACRVATLVHPLEHMAAMGLPVPCMCEDAEDAGRCPFPDLLREGGGKALAHMETRHLAGNAMHCAVLGAWLQFSLACFGPVAS